MSIITAALQRYKLENGDYVIVLPINTTDEVFVDVQNNKNLTQELDEINLTININRDTVLEDNITILKSLSSFIPKPFKLNHIYCINMYTTNYVNVSSGTYIPGKLFI